MIMLELSTYTILALACGLVIISYIFSLISAKTRIPTVLFLLLLGIGIREALVASGHYVHLPGQAIELLGILGLILILLEAGLDINLSRDKLPLIRKATASSLFVMALSVAGISTIIHFGLDQAWLTSLIYALPLSIISSSIVASSIRNLSEAKREFLTYESALSDIFGILLFNYLVATGALSIGSAATMAGGLAIALVASVAASLLLMWLMTKVTIDIKIFLVFAVLFLLYSFGHAVGLPALMLVLIFGLLINNWHKVNGRLINRLLPSQQVGQTAYSLKALTSESAFLIRTFFFLLFGYTIDIHVLSDYNVLVVGSLVVAAIYLVRFIYLRIFLKEHILPELFYAPRGLVTIVLFYRIPQGIQFDSFSDGVLFFVVLATTVIMMIGSLFFTPREATRKAEEEQAEFIESMHSADKTEHLIDPALVDKVTQPDTPPGKTPPINESVPPQPEQTDTKERN